MDKLQGELLHLIDDAAGGQEKVLRSAGEEFLEMVCSQQPWGALGLLVALPDSVLYAPQKAGFGVLYWLCCIQSPAISLLIEALHKAHPELFEDFICTTKRSLTEGCMEDPVEEAGLQILTMESPLESAQRKSVLQKNPIYWCLEHQNPVALKSLLKVGLPVSYFYFYEALRICSFDCALLLEEALHKSEGKRSVLWTKCHKDYAQSALSKLKWLKKEREQKGEDPSRLQALMDYVHALEEQELLESALGVKQEGDASRGKRL